MQIDIVLEPDSPARFAELAALAETYAFGAVWTANHLAARDPFMCFMEAARETRSIRLGPVAISPFEVHPLKMANQLFTLNEYSNGRANLVVGGGGGTVIGMGLKPHRRTMMPQMVLGVSECVEFIKKSATEKPLDFIGQLFQIHGYHPDWTIDTPPRLYIAASKDRMLRLAARAADGLMLSDTPLQLIHATMNVIYKALEDSGRPKSDFRVSNLVSWHVKADRAQAVREARAKLFVRGLLDKMYTSTFMDADDSTFVEKNLGAFAKAYAANSPVIEGVPDRIVDTLVEHLTLTGDLDEVDALTDRIMSYQRAGVDEFAIRLYGQPEDSIRLLGERVVPALQ
jgi:5,10-methylenetetrahydromethanopterin reductase